jgi:putative tryptophan/tyrosine transport system substrate-binding protein
MRPVLSTSNHRSQANGLRFSSKSRRARHAFRFCSIRKPRLNRLTTQSAYYLKSLEAAAAALTLTLSVAHVNSAEEIEAAIADVARLPDGGLVIIPDTFTAAHAHRDLIISLAARHRIPAVYYLRTFVGDGGLVSYGVDNRDLLSRSAGYIDRILKGAKPQDLPVQLPIKFEIAINLKTAKSPGVAVPPSLLAAADEVIE